MQHIHYGGNCCLVLLIPLLLCSTSVCLSAGHPALSSSPATTPTGLAGQRGQLFLFDCSQPTPSTDTSVFCPSKEWQTTSSSNNRPSENGLGRTPFGVNDGHLELKTFSVPIRRIVCQCLQYANYYTCNLVTWCYRPNLHATQLHSAVHIACRPLNCI